MANDVDLISTPFANSGTKNTIPESGASNPQNATMEAGFPTITQTPINEGGIPPERADFNGLGYLTTSHLARLNRGLWYEYDPVFAGKIGGYPLNSRVMLDNGDIVQSTIPNNTNNPNTNTSGWLAGIPARLVADESGLTQQQWNNGIESIAALSSIPSPKNGNRVFVKSIQKWYTYNSGTTSSSNGVTVIDNWEMDTQDEYFASWFADIDNQTDQSIKLQTGYDYATSKSKPFIIDGNFYIDPPLDGTKKVGIYVRSKSTMIFRKGIGSIRMLPTDHDTYDIIRADNNVDGYLIFDPVLIGDKDDHIGTAGEWGYGLTIYQSKNGYIRCPAVSNTWGDGIYIGRSWGTSNDDMPVNIFIDYPVVDGAGRNGISLCAGNNVHINTPLVKNTKGKAPEAGIDIEPEEAGLNLSTLVNCSIHNATLIDNISPINIFASKPNRHIEVNFTGVTTFKNSNASSADQFYVYKRAVAANEKQFGKVYFERLVWDSQRTNLIFGLESPKTGFSIEIDTLELRGLANYMTFNFQGTALAGQPYGDFTINNLDNTGINTSMSKFFMTDSTNLEIESPVKSAISLTQVYEDPAHYVTYAPKSTGDITHTWISWSQNTRIMPNKIWMNPSIDSGGTEFITMYTGDDFRELTIGLDYKTTTVGNGCNINGLVLLIDGVAKTTASTKTLGGWIKFQNVSGGRTRILDSFGVWTFS